MNVFSIKKFNTFGLRNSWIQQYYKTPETFLTQEAKDYLNVKKQLPIFTNWLMSAGLVDSKDKSQTELSKILADYLTTDSALFWQMLWVNL